MNDKKPASNSIPADPEIRYASITNAQIAYKEVGQGEPLIMCTGYTAHMDMWSPRILELLGQHYRVITYDYRGMGYSTNLDSSFSIGTLAEDLNELLMALDINKASILGWSMGGCVAQMFAVKHPEKVMKLVLYATNCGSESAVEPTPEIISILSNPEASPMDMLGTLFPDDWLAENPRPWIFLPPATEPFNSATLSMQYDAMQQWLSPGNGSIEHLHQLEMPVLIICGDQDKVVPPANSRILFEAIRSSYLTMINDSGHGLMYQLPEIFAGHVLAFLEGSLPLDQPQRT